MGNTASRERLEGLLTCLAFPLAVAMASTLPLGGLGIVASLSLVGGFVCWVGLMGQSMNPKVVGPLFGFFTVLCLITGPAVAVRLLTRALGYQMLEELCRQNAAKIGPVGLSALFALFQRFSTHLLSLFTWNDA